MKDKIRPIYTQLQGMLSSAPPEGNSMWSDKQFLVETYNALIDELVNISTDEKYNSLKVIHTFGGQRGLDSTVYRTAINSTIMRLYGSYFSDEKPPFSGPAPTQINQTQTNKQEQNVTIEVAIQLGIELQKALERAKSEEEKSFINKLMEKVGNVKNYIEFSLLLVSTAEKFGITLDRIKTLFGGS